MYSTIAEVALPDGIVLTVQAHGALVRIGVLIVDEWIGHNPYGPAIIPCRIGRVEWTSPENVVNDLKRSIQASRMMDVWAIGDQHLFGVLMRDGEHLRLKLGGLFHSKELLLALLSQEGIESTRREQMLLGAARILSLDSKAVLALGASMRIL